ncbi:hypothetical protein ACIA5C_44940 [Actinoplanes sp. NPDC051343]|uniref:hypothetical protein n=1 Tax=Actinoplanes sp. NPDC051343 TaxID=3363906 RepID=UPI0037B9A797
MYFGAFGGVQEFFSDGIDGVLRKIANAIMSAAASLFANVASKVPTLSPDKDFNHKIGLQINWLVIGVAVASLLFASARMALDRRGQPGMTALKGIVRVILVAGAGSFVVSELATLSDSYSDHLYKAGVEQQLKSIADCGNVDISTFLLIFVGLLLLIAGIIHIILLYLRLGVMVLLFGTLPLAATASMTQWGSSWWRKHIAWMAAWLMYKPTVGLVLYAGSTMIAYTGTQATEQKIAGCGVLLMSAVALPALMRLIVPAMAALGSSDAAGAMAGGALGAAAQATGAISLPGGRGGSGGRSAGSGSPAGGRSGGGGRPTGATSAGKGSPSSGGASGGRAAGAARAGLGAAAGAAALVAHGTAAAARHGTNLAQSALPGVHDVHDHQ